MILGNRGYNAYEVNKKMKGIRYKWENQMAWISYQVWIANGIEEVSSVLVQFKLISLAQYQKTNDINEIYQFQRLPSSNRFRKGKKNIDSLFQKNEIS